MTTSQDTTIHLAQKRGRTNWNWGYQAPLFSGKLKPPFLSPLESFDDLIINPGKEYRIAGTTHFSYFLLPLAGGVELKGSEVDTFIDTGHWCRFQTGKPCSLKIVNPFDQPVNILLIRCHSRHEHPCVETGLIDLTGEPVLLGTEEALLLSVGQFEARQTIDKPLQKAGLAAYVIDGIFEIHDRLLDNRDAIVVPDCQSVEFESFTIGGFAGGTTSRRIQI